MKKLNILLLSALALGITTTSCTKDNAAATPSASIVAKWTFDTYTHTKSGTTSAESPVNDPTCTDKDYMDLRTGGVFEEQMIGTDSTNPCGATKVDGTYTYQNNNIHVTANSTTADYTVVSVTSTKLVFKMPASTTDATEYYTVSCIKQ